VSQRKKTEENSSLNSYSVWNQKRNCFQLLMNSFKYLPLIKSQLRFDPTLYLDNVSNLRKKYKKLELTLHL
jgi:hypothetical protein